VAQSAAAATVALSILGFLPLCTAAAAAAAAAAARGAAIYWGVVVCMVVNGCVWVCMGVYECV